MEIRMNDKIQIEGTVIADCGEYFHMRIAPNVTAYDLKKTWVTKIVERAESDAEKIARLEHEVEALTLFKDFAISRGWVTTPAEHDDLSKQTYDVRVGVNVNDATPNTWESGEDVLTEAETEAMYTELDNYAQAVQGRTEARRALEELRKETKGPWYPEQLRGYGPWIEGPPPRDLNKNFQALGYAEREAKCFSRFLVGNPIPDYYQHCVAYCVKL
jgi:hypothetical protein